MNLKRLSSYMERALTNIIIAGVVTSLILFLDITCKQSICFFILTYSIFKVSIIIINSKLYLFKCYRRKMMLLRNKNQRLFDRILDEDYKIVRGRFPRTCSYKLYSFTVSLSRYLPCKFLFDVRRSNKLK